MEATTSAAQCVEAKKQSAMIMSVAGGAKRNLQRSESLRFIF